MLADGEAKHVVAMKLDRLFRNTEDALNQVTCWDQTGITVHFTDMGGQTLNTQSAMGRMMLTLMSSFAEFERNLISERTAAALGHKKNKRQVYNHVPFGFERSGKELHPYPPEQKVLSQIFEWRATGVESSAHCRQVKRSRCAFKDRKKLALRDHCTHRQQRSLS